MIIQAPTGSGKTVVVAGPHAWAPCEHMVTLMAVPLIALGEEMAQTFQNDFGLKAIVIHSKNGALSFQVIKVRTLSYPSSSSELKVVVRRFSAGITKSSLPLPKCFSPIHSSTESYKIHRSHGVLYRLSWTRDIASPTGGQAFVKSMAR